jgi:hypothetical protein
LLLFPTTLVLKVLEVLVLKGGILLRN